ncbi:MAG: HlyD family secretion protein [Polaribacter sp.]|jgi:HlyD family secretion protein
MKKAKRKNNKLIWILLGVTALLIVAAVIQSGGKKKGIPVELDKVSQRTIKETVSASGKVFPEKEVKISSDVSGEIVELFVEEGDSISAGQLLLRIDPDAYQSAVERGRASVNNAKANMANSKAATEGNKAQLIQAGAEIDRIKAQIENTRSIHERNDKLFKDGVISIADFEASLSNLKTLEANLRSANASKQAAEASLESAKQQVAASSFTVKSQEASLKELQTNLRRTTIYAPVNGVISMLNVEQGERVVGTAQMTGTEIMRLSNLDIMEVQVDVSETDVLRVSLNDETNIEVDAYIDRKFKGVVTEIANSATGASSSSLTTDQVTNFVVKIRIDSESYKDLISPNKPYPFRPGMSASVDITTETKKGVICVPIQAVTTREKDEDENEDSESDDSKEVDDEDILEVVFLSENGKAKMVEVKTGIQDDDYIEILGGLSEGTEVVTGPFSAVSKKLKDEKEIYEEEKKKGKKKKS